MSTNRSPQAVRAASDNLQLTIRGLVEIGVSLVGVIRDDEEDRPSQADARAPPDARGSEADVQGGELAEEIRSGLARLNLASDRSAHADRLSLTQPPPCGSQSSKCSATSVVSTITAEKFAPGERRHFCVFCGKKVGITSKWSEATDWTNGIPGSSQRGFKTRAAAIREFEAALREGHVKLIDTSRDGDPDITIVSANEPFDDDYATMTRFSDPAAYRRFLARPLTSTSVTTPSSVSGLSATSSTSYMSDESLYGLDESAEFDALCHEAVDLYEASISSA